MEVVSCSVATAMQLRNTVSHIFQSAVHVLFFSMTNRLDLHMKIVKFPKY